MPMMMHRFSTVMIAITSVLTWVAAVPRDIARVFITGWHVPVAGHWHAGRQALRTLTAYLALPPNSPPVVAYLIALRMSTPTRIARHFAIMTTIMTTASPVRLLVLKATEWWLVRAVVH
jgi:hypothetical protein